jgi:hypothetical protein
MPSAVTTLICILQPEVQLSGLVAGGMIASGVRFRLVDEQTELNDGITHEWHTGFSHTLFGSIRARHQGS